MKISLHWLPVAPLLVLSPGLPFQPVQAADAPVAVPSPPRQERPTYFRPADFDSKLYKRDASSRELVRELERAKLGAAGLSAAQEIELNFDLAQALVRTGWYEYYVAAARQRYAAWANPDRPATAQPATTLTVASAAYDPNWSLPHKLLFLYDEIVQLDTTPERHAVARAMWIKGLFARFYQGQLGRGRATRDGCAP